MPSNWTSLLCDPFLRRYYSFRLHFWKNIWTSVLTCLVFALYMWFFCNIYASHPFDSNFSGAFCFWISSGIRHGLPVYPPNIHQAWRGAPWQNLRQLLNWVDIVAPAALLIYCFSAFKYWTFPSFFANVFDLLIRSYNGGCISSAVGSSPAHHTFFAKFVSTGLLQRKSCFMLVAGYGYFHGCSLSQKILLVLFCTASENL